MGQVDQLRKGVAEIIANNPVTVTRKSDSVIETARISHERAQLPAASSSPVGQSTNERLFLLCLYSTVLKKGDVITDANGGKYTLGAVVEHRIENAIYSKGFPLTVTL